MRLRIEPVDTQHARAMWLDCDFRLVGARQNKRAQSLGHRFSCERPVHVDATYFEVLNLIRERSRKRPQPGRFRAAILSVQRAWTDDPQIGLLRAKRMHASCEHGATLSDIFHRRAVSGE